MIEYTKDIILNSNLTLRRNIEGLDFPATMTLEDSERVIDIFRSIYGEKLVLLENLDETFLNKLINSFALSEDYDDRSIKVAVVIEDDYVLTINDRDHVAINIMDFNMDMKKALDKAREVEEDLDRIIDFAFSPEYGYLTSDARNTGSGLEIFLETFLFGLVGSYEAYFGLKQSLIHDGIFISSESPLAIKNNIRGLYILKNVGNYRKDMKGYIKKFEEALDTLVRNERRFRRDYQALNGIKDEEIEDRIDLIVSNLSMGLLKNLDIILKALYELKKYRALDYETKLSSNEIDYLIFNLSKKKYKGNRDEERYQFLRSYMEGR